MIHWAVWVMKEFNIDEMEIGSIHIPGRDLCAFSQEEFLQKVPNGEILWSHLELLRKCESRPPLPRPSDSFLGDANDNLQLVMISDVLASQDQSGGDATVTIDQRKCQNPRLPTRRWISHI